MRHITLHRKSISQIAESLTIHYFYNTDVLMNCQLDRQLISYQAVPKFIVSAIEFYLKHYMKVRNR